MSTESQLIAQAADTAGDLARAVITLALVSALLLRGALDLGARAVVQRNLLRRWTGRSSHSFVLVEMDMNRLGSRASLYALDFRQICAQLSAAVQYQLNEGHVETVLLKTFVPPEGEADLTLVSDQATSSDARQAALQRLSSLIERAIDDLQAYFTQSMTRFVYEATLVITLVSSALIVQSANARVVQASQTSPTATVDVYRWAPLALLAFALIYLVFTLRDAGVHFFGESHVEQATIWWGRNLVLVTAAALLVGVLLVAANVPDWRATAIFLLVGYGSAVLCPIFMSLLGRLTQQR